MEASDMCSDFIDPFKCNNPGISLYIFILYNIFYI